MAIPYEKIVAEDIDLGTGTVTVSMPAGGSATGHQVNLQTFAPHTTLDTYPDNASAKTAGLEVGTLYKTSDGALMVVC